MCFVKYRLYLSLRRAKSNLVVSALAGERDVHVRVNGHCEQNYANDSLPYFQCYSPKGVSDDAVGRWSPAPSQSNGAKSECSYFVAMTVPFKGSSSTVQLSFPVPNTIVCPAVSPCFSSSRSR